MRKRFVAAAMFALIALEPSAHAQQRVAIAPNVQPQELVAMALMTRMYWLYVARAAALQSASDAGAPTESAADASAAAPSPFVDADTPIDAGERETVAPSASPSSSAEPARLSAPPASAIERTPAEPTVIATPPATSLAPEPEPVPTIASEPEREPAPTIVDGVVLVRSRASAGEDAGAKMLAYEPPAISPEEQSGVLGWIASLLTIVSLSFTTALVVLARRR